MIRNILMASAMLMGVSGAAMADSWNPPLPPHAHSEPVSEGSPHLTGLNQGNADIQYSGEAKGNLANGGTPIVVGSEGGSPVIVYR